MSVWSQELATGVHLVVLSGPLNIHRVEDVSRLFRSLSERGVVRVVIDLRDVPLMDGPGLAALISGYNILGGDACNFTLVGVQDQPRLVLELTGFDNVFEVADADVGADAGAISYGSVFPIENVSAFAELTQVW
jgi:anti-anti-sigma factor